VTAGRVKNLILGVRICFLPFSVEHEVSSAYFVERTRAMAVCAATRLVAPFMLWVVLLQKWWAAILLALLAVATYIYVRVVTLRMLANGESLE
jgi:hypothetical protein